MCYSLVACTDGLNVLICDRERVLRVAVSHQKYCGKHPMHRRCPMNCGYCYFQQRTLTVAGGGLCSCLELLGLSPELKLTVVICKNDSKEHNVRE
jgi:hypothetical protein